MSKRGWVSLGMCLFGAACALDERAIDATQTDGASGNDMLGGSSPPGSGMGGSESTTEVTPPAGSPPPGSDVPFLPGTPLVPGTSNAGTSNAGTPNAGTPNAGTPNAGTPDPQPQGSEVEPTQSLTFDGDGFGRVTLSAPGLADQVCERDCQVSAPAGTFVTLQATAQPYSVFRSWSGTACGAQQVCSITVDANVPLRVDFQLAYNVAFVTDQIYTVAQLPAPGAEANQECARFAAAAGLHGQRWVAWFAADGPTTALQDDVTPGGFLQNPGGWLRSDGAPLVLTRSALFARGLRNPLRLTETRALAARSAWSGVGFDGGVDRPDAVNATDCENWTSSDSAVYGAISNRDSVGLNWTGSSVQVCSGTAALECFGDDPSPEVPLPPLPASARLAFVSNAAFSPGDGIQSADELCQQEACAAGLTGSGNCSVDFGTQRAFLSYLHTSLQPAWERFDLSGPTWYRPDGIQWLPSAAALAVDAAGNLTGINVLADATIDPGSNTVWLGRPSGDENCDDWGNSSATGAFGSSDDVGYPMTLAGREFACSNPAKVICLQQ